MQGVTKQVSGWGGVYIVGEVVVAVAGEVSTLVILWMSRVETYDGPAWRLISTLCGESATRNLANRSMHIQDLYVGPFPIPRFIKE